MHDGTGDTVNQEASFPQRPLPLPDLALAAAVWLYVACGLGGRASAEELLTGAKFL